VCVVRSVDQPRLRHRKNMLWTSECSSTIHRPDILSPLALKSDTSRFAISVAQRVEKPKIATLYTSSIVVSLSLLRLSFVGLRLVCAPSSYTGSQAAQPLHIHNRLLETIRVFIICQTGLKNRADFGGRRDTEYYTERALDLQKREKKKLRCPKPTESKNTQYPPTPEESSEQNRGIRKLYSYTSA